MERHPTSQDIENMKKVLVSAGVLKSTSVTEAERTKVTEGLSKVVPVPHQFVCNSEHWCIVVAPKPPKPVEPDQPPEGPDSGPPDSGAPDSGPG
jgi:hypothetical protein